MNRSWTALALGCVVALLTTALVADAATIRVRCERRPDRSKISVDGNNLTPLDANFKAVVMSGSNMAMSDLQQADGDEAEFDFDSAADDIAEGATAIGEDFIQGGQVTGKILNEAGNTVISDTVNCRVRD